MKHIVHKLVDNTGEIAAEEPSIVRPVEIAVRAEMMADLQSRELCLLSWGERRRVRTLLPCYEAAPLFAFGTLESCV